MGAVGADGSSPKAGALPGCATARHRIPFIERFCYTPDTRRVLIPVVATAISVLKNDGEIVPVDGFRRLSTWGKVAVVNIDSTNRQRNSHDDRARVGAFACVSADASFLVMRGIDFAHRWRGRLASAIDDGVIQRWLDDEASAAPWHVSRRMNPCRVAEGTDARSRGRRRSGCPRGRQSRRRR